jgi:hypothetical protein
VTWRTATADDAVALRDLRARDLFEHLGWEPTGREQPAEWPPYPTELEYRLPEFAHGL